MLRMLRPLLIAVAALGLLLPAASEARMKSTKLPDGTCSTTGGGKVVDLPGFPGERIDRRLLTDIKWLQKRYPIFVTDGYSNDGVHSPNGEHPLGLALDIVADKANGGTWGQITELALFAEPKQNQPRAPFRWVGYDGDAGHGRGNHLHLSWSHSTVTKPGRLARTVYTIKCPKPPAAQQEPEPNPGGTEAGQVKHPDSPSTGGIKAKLAPVVAESGGVGVSG